MRDISKVVLRGTVSDAPQVRNFDGGGKLVTFSMKTVTMEGDERGGRTERPAWHRIAVGGERNAEAAEGLTVEAPVYVEGRLRTRRYTGRDGNEEYATDVRADILYSPESAEPHLNHSFILGAAGRTPELRTFEGRDFCVMNITIATNESFFRRSGEQGDETEWHRVAVFGDLARGLDGKIEKGQRLFVEGRVRTRKYTDRSGRERRSTETEPRSVIPGSKSQRSAESGYQGRSDGGRRGGAEEERSRRFDEKLRRQDDAGSGASGVDTSGGGVDDVPF